MPEVIFYYVAPIVVHHFAQPLENEQTPNINYDKLHMLFGGCCTRLFYKIDTAYFHA